MPIKVPTGGQSNPVPAGTHQAVCYGVCAVGTLPSQIYASRPKVVIIWELPQERADFGDKKNQPRAISARYTLSFDKKATLRKIMESWRGRAFTDAELSTFEMDRMIGANCLLGVQHMTKEGKTFANISSVSPLAKGMPKLASENERLYFNIWEAIELSKKNNTPVEFPANMPEWMVLLAKTSEEYQAHANEKETAQPAPAADEQEGHEPTGEQPF